MATHGYSVLTEGDQARIVPNAEAKTENSDNANLTGPDALKPAYCRCNKPRSVN